MTTSRAQHPRWPQFERVAGKMGPSVRAAPRFAAGILQFARGDLDDARRWWVLRVARAILRDEGFQWIEVRYLYGDEFHANYVARDV